MMFDSVEFKTDVGVKASSWSRGTFSKLLPIEVLLLRSSWVLFIISSALIVKGREAMLVVVGIVDEETVMLEAAEVTDTGFLVVVPGFLVAGFVFFVLGFLVAVFGFLVVVVGEKIETKFLRIGLFSKKLGKEGCLVVVGEGLAVVDGASVVVEACVEDRVDSKAGSEVEEEIAIEGIVVRSEKVVAGVSS